MIKKKQKFIKKLNECVNVMNSNNHHLAFFHDCVSIEINIMKTDELIHSDSQGKRILHPLPFHEIKNLFLPMYTDANDPVYKTEDELFFAWRRRYKKPENHFQMRREYYAQKNSWVVQKIFSLSDDFTGKIIDIANTTGIPLSSLHDMYVFMTGINDFKQNRHQLRLQHYLSYPIPDSIPEDQRDILLVQTWMKIFFLLLEAYWVIALVVMVDVMNVLGLYGSDGLEAARAYLIHSTVYSELEKQIIAIDTPYDLRDYMKKEFSFIEDLLTAFNLFAHETAHKFVAIKKHREEWQLKPLWPANTIRKNSKHNSDKALTNEEQSDEEQSREEIPDDEHFEEEQMNQNSTLATITETHISENKCSEKDIYLSDTTVLVSLEKRMEIQGLLKTYRLMGNPENVVNYLIKTVYNEVRTILQNNYSSKIKNEYGISKKTFDRWKKEINWREYDIAARPERPLGVKNISDLFPEEIDAIIKTKRNKQFHRENGYLTQNQLINLLQSESSLKFLSSKGIAIKKYSRTTLRNRLSKLIKTENIPYQKKGVSYFFKAADVPLILKKLSNLF